LFRRHPAPRHLHSFPTRRSSDLSHPVPVPAPEGITFRVEAPTRFVVEGIDKQQVGEVAAKIRKLRRPDPYKGKGVRYQGEVIRRDRKSTRLNSSHVAISYAVFCL